ncbi:FkbM family methyltransferase [Candidatus Pelagibacter sp.]|nr:FkbM family methyltransferase [Candidatus Pelagibacter sp.]
MIKYLILIILKIFDFFHQRKIIKFLHKKGFKNFDIIFDVGAHKGESINLFLSNFKTASIYSFEASPITFKILSDKIDYIRNKFKNSKIIIENYAIGSVKKKVSLKQLKESSSSTIRNLNENSKYFKKKLFFLQGDKRSPFFKEVEVDQIRLSDYLVKNNIGSIDFLKIDTEGYEFEVLIGAKDVLSKISIVLFEHHYDDMIAKNYKFSDIHNFFLTNNFTQLYKSKMPFRKTFEYIYINKFEE